MDGEGRRITRGQEGRSTTEQATRAATEVRTASVKKEKNRERPGADEYIWQEDEARVSPDVRCTDGHRNQARYVGIAGAGDGGDWERNVGVEGRREQRGRERGKWRQDLGARTSHLALSVRPPSLFPPTFCFSFLPPASPPPHPCPFVAASASSS